MALTRPKYSQIYDTDWKQSAEIATTGSDVGNLTVGNSQPSSLDGVSLQTGYRILVKDQTNGWDNGLYIVANVGTGSNGWWKRTLDANQTGFVTAGLTVTVVLGSVNGGREFRLTTPDPITLGVTSLTFINPYSAAQAGGANTQVQFNDASITNGTAGFTFNKYSNAVVMSGTLTVGNVTNQGSETITGNLSAANIIISGAGQFTGPYNETDTRSGVFVGNAGSGVPSPRLGFFNGNTTQNWQVDNYFGQFRWFTPGVTRMSLDPGGNLTVSSGSIISAGNVSATYYIGSGQFLSSLPGYAYSNVNVAAYTQTQSYTNYSNVNVIAYLGTVSSAVTVGGNLTVQGNLIVLGNLTTLNVETINTTEYISSTGNLVINNSAPSTSTTTGVIVAQGGVGIGGNLNVGTVGAVSGAFHSVVGNITQTSSGGAVYFNTTGNVLAQAGVFNSITTNGTETVQLLNSTGNVLAVGVTSAAANVNGSLAVGGISSFNNTTNAIPYQLGSGAVYVAGGMSIAKDVWVSGNIYAGNILSTTANILVVQDSLLYLQRSNLYPYTYSIGFYADYIGGPANTYVHTALVKNWTDSNWYFLSNIAEPTPGNVNVSDANRILDGIIAGSINVSGNVLSGDATNFRTNVNSTLASTSTTSGALQVAGGAGIAGNTYIGGNLYAGYGASPNTNTHNIVGNLNVGVAYTSNYPYRLTVATNTQSVDGLNVNYVGTGNQSSLTFRANMSQGSNNGLVQAGDTGIVYSFGSIGTGYFDIVPWSGVIGGIRMDYNGNVNIGGTFPATSTSTGVLNVSGGVGVSGNIFHGGYNFGNPTGGAGIAGPGQTGILPAYQYYNLYGNVALVNGVGDQRIFNANVFVAAATTYEFETMFDIYKNTAAGGSSSVLQFNLGTNLTGAATFNWINYQYISGNISPAVPSGGQIVTSTANAANIGWSNVATNVGIAVTSTNSTSQHNWAMVKGTLSVNAGGWISPRINYTVAPGGVTWVQSGSYMKLAAIGYGGANLSIGSWAT